MMARVFSVKQSTSGSGCGGIRYGGLLALTCAVLLACCRVQATPITATVSKTDQDAMAILYFRAAIDADLSTNGSYVGDTFEGHVLQDVKRGDQILAPAGSRLVGHIDDRSAARGVLPSLISGHKLQSHGFLSIKLDKIIRPDKKELLVEGTPLKQQSIFGTEGRFKEIDVDDNGIIRKAASLDMWGSPDMAMVLPESIVRFGRHLDVHIEEGDQLDFKAEVPPEELALFMRSLNAGDDKTARQQAGRVDSIPH